MWKLLGKVLLVGVVISFAYVNSYAGDKDHYYQGPNYDDPTAPNYMGGTRTDMAPKVDVSTTKEEESSFCEPSEGTKELLENADDSRWSDDPISGVTHQWQIIQSQKIWDEECQEKEKNKDKEPPPTIWRPAR